MHDIYTVPMQAVWFTGREESKKKRQTAFSFSWVPSLPFRSNCLTQTRTHTHTSFFFTLDGCGCLMLLPGHLPQEKNEVPIVLGGILVRSGQLQKILCKQGFNPQTVQLIVSHCSSACSMVHWKRREECEKTERQNTASPGFKVCFLNWHTRARTHTHTHTQRGG